MESSILQVECSYTRGFSGLQLIGNTSEVCKSGLERAKAALESLGILIPQKRIIINICPAPIRKDGSHFDLPFAVGLAVLITGKKPRIPLDKWLFSAELGLNGTLRPVKGMISFAIASMAEAFQGIVLSQENLEEVSVLNNLKLKGTTVLEPYAFKSLKDVLDWLFLYQESYVLKTAPGSSTKDRMTDSQPTFDDMILDPTLENVALVAATGLHSVLLTGAPGTGKSMFSARLTSIFPRMQKREHLESLKIYSSVMQRIPECLLSGRPPFRAPHHQSSSSAIMGVPEQPGEISLAHGGILFLDEFPEFRRDIIEALREPLETSHVRVSRAKKKVTWLSKMTLIAACNSCPCGWLGSSIRRCSCPSPKILAYKRKLSGPILDRIDLHVRMVESQKNSALFLDLKKTGMKNQTQRLSEKVLRARDFSKRRNESLGITYNRDLKADQLLEASGMDANDFKKLVDLCTPKYASQRAIIRSLRVARTLADIESLGSIEKRHIVEAWKWLPQNSDTLDGNYSV